MTKFLNRIALAFKNHYSLHGYITAVYAGNSRFDKTDWAMFEIKRGEETIGTYYHFRPHYKMVEAGEADYNMTKINYKQFELTNKIKA